MRRVLLILLLIAVEPLTVYGQLDSGFIAGMKARSIGPAGMSGRISAIDAVPGSPEIIYVGAATGGVWKSTNSGVSWTPVFDEQRVNSIGALAIDPVNPNIVWVGTGEANVRNTAGVGRGVYKSIDGGKSWNFVGLEKTEHICRILLDPFHPETAYVGAMGTTWGENSDRGVFKTTDGGATWQKILFVDSKTGVGDMAMDPFNPNKLLVSMWEHRRWPWFFKSGGMGSGLYVTTDGGRNWKKQSAKEGLPEGELGRIGVAFAAGRSNIVYAMVEAKKSELLRSDDGGFSWKTVNKDVDVNPRPFYFGRIAVNPKNENLVYRIEFLLSASEDGGKTFDGMSRWSVIHPDYHALWLDPDGERIIAGNDGGIAMSNDRGKTWRFVENLPLGQFYHISYDMNSPYNVYGGMQDNGSWRGPSTTFKKDGIYNHEWEMVGFGDGFDTEPDPDNPKGGYAMSQGGYLFYSDYLIGARTDIRPNETAVRQRYNWNAGFALDPFDSRTIYYGSQFVHKSTDKGRSWTVISPDLTTNDSSKLKQAESGGLTPDVTAAENHCTILTIAPSSLQKNVLWVGTDDGNVQLTTNGGKTWDLLSDRIKARNKSETPPAGTWVPHIEASRHDAATAYVVFDDHRRSNWQPYVFVTRDFGKTWQSLSTSQLDGFVHVVEEDPVNKNLLFAGTEFGLFVSMDAGKNWTKWTAGVPTVPVTDIAIHPRDHDLIVGTHGRSAYILDDITPLRELASRALNAFPNLFEIQDAIQYHTEYWAGPYSSSGDAMFKGKPRDYGAIITYVANPPDSVAAWEGTVKEKKVRIEILDGDSIIRVIKGPDRKGLNRVAWDLCRGEFHTPHGTDSLDIEHSGLFVLPGTYAVRFKYEGKEFKQTVKVNPDPRMSFDATGREQSQKLAESCGILLNKISMVYRQIEDIKKSILQIEARTAHMDSTTGNSLKRRAEVIKKKMASFQKKIDADPDTKGIIDDSDFLRNRIGDAMYAASSNYGSPTEAATVKFENVRKAVSEFLSTYHEFRSTEVETFAKDVANAGVPLFEKYEDVR